MTGAVIAVAGLLLIALGPSEDQTPGRIVRDVAFLAVAALPVSMVAGILKYHLYDVGRLITRTVSYTLVTVRAELAVLYAPPRRTRQRTLSTYSRTLSASPVWWRDVQDGRVHVKSVICGLVESSVLSGNVPGTVRA